MDRRSFLKVGAAVSTLFALPEQMAASPIRWDLFTCEDAFRYSLESPFAQGDFGYATNGYIALRTSATDGVFRNATDGKHPDMAKCWGDNSQESGCWSPLHLNRRDSKLGRCHACFGRGYLGKAVDCSECDCEGVVFTGEWDDYHEPMFGDCEHCHGFGFIGELCKACKGMPYSKSSVVQLNDGREIDAANAARIMTLGDVQYRELRNPDNSDCVEFRFDRGCGLVMPVVGR